MAACWAASWSLSLWASAHRASCSASRSARTASVSLALAVSSWMTAFAWLRWVFSSLFLLSRVLLAASDSSLLVSRVVFFS